MRRVYLVTSLCLLATVAYSAQTGRFTEAQRSFWSFQPVEMPDVPDVGDDSWVGNPVDAFVLSRLEENGLEPNPPADRRTLLRRVTIDLTGLPPTEAEIEAYLADDTPDAFSKVVERLLASPAYGERWGRHWLDVARYADSDGFKADATRPHIWRYRDYVIEAFNDDKPYDRFIREQIAGDELYPGSREALVAMGFNRHWIDETNAAGIITRRQETLDEITSATGAAFLGLTVACARCHDHKFDPILQKDFYRLQAFFANTSFGDGPLPIADPVERRAYEEQLARWEEATRTIREEMERIVAPLREPNAPAYFEEPVQEAILMDPAKRDSTQAMWFHTASNRVVFTGDPDDRRLGRLDDEAGVARYKELREQLAGFEDLKPAPPDEGQFMIDISPTAPPIHVLAGGNPLAPVEEVQPGFLSILDPGDAPITPLPELESTGRRTALAEWLTDPDNPLTARVMVNRIWHHHFGRGIVATPGDFGRQGARPTHPELLDFLAAYFVVNGWSIKDMHRLILLSSTYRMSSAYREDAAAVDPDNDLLWRYERRRMEGEAIRDSILFVSGLLNPEMGGPGVYPPVPSGYVSELSSTAAAGGWQIEEDQRQNLRRSVYIFQRRNLPYPMVHAFDGANMFQPWHSRSHTVTPIQSLEMLNDELVVEYATAFAGRLLGDGSGATEAWEYVDPGFRLAFGRGASAEELQSAAAFLEQQIPVMAARLADPNDERVPLPGSIPEGMDPAGAAALVDLCHMLLVSNEFLYID